MTKICIVLSDETALRFRKYALQKTGSMKGLSIIGSYAIEEYLATHSSGEKHD